ncbi:MAG: thiamine phosphate synthase [Bacteroidetes bacterium QS_8_68_15]|nr:MAG: thiamine phosphate synthase [Bacteroidetes bacterium QS_8_68_15]
MDDESQAGEPSVHAGEPSVVRRPSSLLRLALIADGFASDPATADRTVAAARAGALWVHLRDHEAGDDAFADAARALADRLRAAAPSRVRLSVNSRLNEAEALSAGLHTGRHGPSVDAARRALGPDALVGASAHDAGEARAAAGADYYFFSPVFPTASKPDHPGAGLDTLRRFCRTVPETPIFALGGVTPERVAPCRAAGAHGVAVRSGILYADDPPHATRQYLHALRRA